MSHVRQQIREQIQAQLLGDSNVSATVGTRVYRSRAYPDNVLPVVGVYANTERDENVRDIEFPKLYNRNLDVVVEIKAKAVSDVDDTVDLLAAYVEAELGSDQTLGGLTQDLVLLATDSRVVGEGEKALMVARLTWRAWYRTTAADPETAV